MRVVSLLSVVAFLVTLEDCVHPISESIQCEDCLKWEIFGSLVIGVVFYFNKW